MIHIYDSIPYIIKWLQAMFLFFVRAVFLDQMKSFAIIKRYAIYTFWICFLLNTVFVLVFFFGARHVGRLEAGYDLWRGRYEIHGYGLYMGAPYEIEILKPFGVEYRHVSGCLVNGFIMDSVAAYNITMLKAIKEDLSIEIEWPVIFFEDALKDEKGMEGFEQETEGGSKPHSDVTQIVMQTREPEEGDAALYEIEECFEVAAVDLDGDKEQEDLCLSYLRYKGHDDTFIYTSLVVNLIKGFKHLLRQELDRSYYFEERFVSLTDINADGREELITQVRLSPDCAGCDAYRIYEFESDRFNLVLGLVDIEPENRSIRDFWNQIEEYDKQFLIGLKNTSTNEYPCGIIEQCIHSTPWLLDTDDDGQLEIVMLIETPKDHFDFNDQPNYLFYAKRATNGEIFQYHLKPISLGYAEATRVIGFLKTRDKRTHLLINAAGSGTSSAFPKLTLFDIHWPKIAKIGELSGVYEHALAERFRDLDGDGNTEIIYVGETYPAPEGARANSEVSYDIAEYRDGNYVENNSKFANSREQINERAIDPSFQKADPPSQDTY